MNIEPQHPTAENPPEQFADDRAATTTWKEHITDDEFNGSLTTAGAVGGNR
ncbi:hypothetical protein [Microbacterium pumilum]|uniref:Uncharacterized protein n=1 Tax=Microbacterium pumilum TaxID=344165 RepID=A0ABN2RTF2_9MICO